jgi:glycosyltransferase involved in cell wall biosynthesis
VGRRSGERYRAFDGLIAGTDIPVHYCGTIDIPGLNHSWAIKEMKAWLRDNGRWDVILLYNVGYETVSVAKLFGGKVPLVLEYEDDATIALSGARSYDRIRGRRHLAAMDTRISGVTLVNEMLPHGLQTKNILFLPGIVEDEVTTPICSSFTSGGRVRVVYSGGMTHLKGVDILIEAVKYVDDGLDLQLFGSGPLAEMVGRACEQNGSHHGMSFRGLVSRDTLDAAMCAADIFVNPHRMNDHLHSLFPFKVFEYISFGKPVVSAKLPPVPGGLTRGTVVYDGDNPSSLASALTSCVRNYNSLRQAAVAASQELRSQYSVTSLAPKLTEFLKRAIQQPSL